MFVNVLDRMSHFKCCYSCSMVLLTTLLSLNLMHALCTLTGCQRPHATRCYWKYKYCCLCCYCCRCCGCCCSKTTSLHLQMKSFPFCMRLKLDTVFIIVEISKRWIRKATAENTLHSPFSHMDRKCSAWRMRNTRTITWKILFLLT